MTVPGTSIVRAPGEHQSDLLDIGAKLDGSQTVAKVVDDSVNL